MKARYKVAIGLAGLAVVGAALAPELGFGQQTSDRDSSLDKIVTKRFEDVNANQVFAWLAEQGFSFVVKDGEFAHTRVTLNLDHQTLRDAANSVADALGGHWDLNGKVFVFHRGNGFKMLPKDDGGFVWSDSQAPHVPFLFDGDGQIPKDQQKKWEDWGKKFGQHMKGFQFQMPDMNFDMPDSGWTPEQKKQFEKKWEDWGKKFGDQMKDFHFDSGSHKMTPEQERAFEKQMEEMSKMLEKQFQGGKFPFDGKNMDPKMWQKFGEGWEKWGQEFGKGFGGDGQAPPAPPVPPMPPSSGSKEGSNFMRIRIDGTGDAAVVESGGVRALLNSLSPGQKDALKDKGYLTPNDLTEEQSAKLGHLPSGGQWTMSFSQNGDSIEIRNR